MTIEDLLKRGLTLNTIAQWVSKGVSLDQLSSLVLGGKTFSQIETLINTGNIFISKTESELGISKDQIATYKREALDDSLNWASTTEYKAANDIMNAQNDDDLQTVDASPTHRTVSLNRVNCSVLIVDIRNNRTFESPMIPDDVQINTGISWESVDVRMATEPFMGYSSTGPRSLSFTLQLHDDFLPDGIVPTVSFLESICYPTYSGGFVQEPWLS